MTEPFTIRQILEDTPDRSLRFVAEKLGVEGYQEMPREHIINVLEPLIQDRNQR